MNKRKERYMGKKEFDTCGHCCTWCNDMEGKSPYTVRDTYPKMIRKVLRHKFHMGKKAATEFIGGRWCGACYGNWDRLHESTAEKSLRARDYAEMLVGDVWYCSDRFTWDRLLRIQWMYQRLNDRCEKEHGHE